MSGRRLRLRNPKSPSRLHAPECLEVRALLHGGHAFLEFQDDTLLADSGFAASSSHYSTHDRSHSSITSDTAARPDAEVELRTFRIAIAATGEYTQFHGGTVANGQAAIETAVQRLNELFVTELGIRFELVPNNELLVFTDASTDPYTNGNTSAMLGENQAHLDRVIGNSNYDIGHVLGTSGGGLASLAIVGVDGLKGRGVTASPVPDGDRFIISRLAHEIGHQLGARHTFNSSMGSCARGRFGPSAFEPGSGSTIMSYAGLCGEDNVQRSADPFFHSTSLEEIAHHVDQVIPNVGQRTLTANHLPTVNAGANYTIPANTPFALTAAGSDVDGDQLTYSWEQRDLGPARQLSSGDTGEGPLFPALPPSTNPTRVFANDSDATGVTSPHANVLPTTSRTLNFRATVRDNRSDAGGVNSDDMTVTVVDTGSRFQVHQPLGSLSWNTGAIETVRWDTAGTRDSAIGVEHVNVLLSIDGGETFDIMLAASTPNDGSVPVTVPNVPTKTARIKVEPVDNIFFAISENDFTIVETVGDTPVAEPGMTPLVAVDFDKSDGTSPSGWTKIGRSQTPLTRSNLTDESGNVTPFSLTIDEGPDRFVNHYSANPHERTLPSDTQPFHGIDGQIFTDGDPITLTWSGLDAEKQYEVYVLAAESVYSSIRQTVEITGSGSSLVFEQHFGRDELAVNDQIGDSAVALSSFAKHVSPNANGELEIRVMPASGTRDVVLSGIAIREFERVDYLSSGASAATSAQEAWIGHQTPTESLAVSLTTASSPDGFEPQTQATLRMAPEEPGSPGGGGEADLHNRHATYHSVTHDNQSQDHNQAVVGEGTHTHAAPSQSDARVLPSWFARRLRWVVRSGVNMTAADGDGEVMRNAGPTAPSAAEAATQPLAAEVASAGLVAVNVPQRLRPVQVSNRLGAPHLQVNDVQPVASTMMTVDRVLNDMADAPATNLGEAFSQSVALNEVQEHASPSTSTEESSQPAVSVVPTETGSVRLARRGLLASAHASVFAELGLEEEER